MPPAPPRRAARGIAAYLRLWAIATLLLAVAIAGLAVGVDPWFVFGTPRIAGFNAVKPRAVAHSTLAKTYQLARVCGRTLLLGNSRVEVGLDPDSAAWPEPLRPVFNAAAAGAGPAFALATLRRALAACPPPRLVVVEVDFPDFLTAPQAPRPDEPAAPRDGLVTRLGDWARAALSLDALSDSLATLLAQRDPAGPTLTPQGLNPLREYAREVAAHGYAPLFAEKLADYAAQLRAAPEPVLDAAHSEPLRILAALIRLAEAHRIALVLFVPPYHASYLDLLHQSGRWETFLAFKRALAALVPGAGAAPLDPAALAGQTRLIDFSADYPTLHEPVPPRGDTTTPMRFYWESGHFKPALGEAIIARLFRGGDFGTAIAGPATAESRRAGGDSCGERAPAAQNYPQGEWGLLRGEAGTLAGGMDGKLPSRANYPEDSCGTY
jgi:hypothetical protein